MTILTPEIYWASKHHEIVALGGVADFSARQAAASALNDQGLIIDLQIDIWRWDPVLMMGTRQMYGYSWVPNAYQPNLVNPFQLLPGDHTDMSKPWPRSIKVSIDAADYPPIETVPPPLAKKIVGPFIGNGIYGCNIADVSKDGQWLFSEGQKYVQDGVAYYFHLGHAAPFGFLVPEWLDKAPA